MTARLEAGQKGQGADLALRAAAVLSGAPQDTLSLYKTDLKQPWVRGQSTDWPCSISHVAGVVSAAVTSPGLRIGVDVEQVSRFEALGVGMLEAMLSPAERALRPDWDAEALSHIWRLKEAFLKATGTGFRDRPATYELAHLTADRVHDLGDGRFWRHWQTPLGQGCWVTVGVLGSDFETVCACRQDSRRVQVRDLL